MPVGASRQETLSFHGFEPMQFQGLYGNDRNREKGSEVAGLISEKPLCPHHSFCHPSGRRTWKTWMERTQAFDFDFQILLSNSISGFGDSMA